MPQLFSEPVSQIVYDERRWPFVVVTFPPGAFTDAQLTTHLADIDAYRKRGGPFGFVMDARLAAPPTPAQRRVIVENMDRMGREDGTRFIGVAVVLTSAPGRAVFKALLWLRQENHPLTAVASIEQGIEWLRGLQQKIASKP